MLAWDGTMSCRLRGEQMTYRIQECFVHIKSHDMGSHIAEFLVYVAYNLHPQRDTQISKKAIQLKKITHNPITESY
jgi:hypothetical protein